MRRDLPVCVAVVAALLLIGAPSADAQVDTAKPAVAKPATPAHPKRHVVRRSRGYGFLPGYRSPERIEWEDRVAAWGRGPAWWYGGPRFYRNRWNSGGFGPCWTQTPIGNVWNCGQ